VYPFVHFVSEKKKKKKQHKKKAKRKKKKRKSIITFCVSVLEKKAIFCIRGEYFCILNLRPFFRKVLHHSAWCLAKLSCKTF